MEAKAREIVAREIESARKGMGSSSNNGVECFACHVIRAIMHGCDLDESAAADMLSQMLDEDEMLNERFIDAVEYLHLYSRGRALWFYGRSRREKDDYLAMHVKNALTELEHELRDHGREAPLRRLLLSYLSIYIAQMIGMDLHAGTEEVYYLLRRNYGLEQDIAELLRKMMAG